MKNVYLFEEGSANQKMLLGGKGANLAEMTKISLPVPPGFTITTDVCRDYTKRGEKVLKEIENDVLEKLKNIEKKVQREFGSDKNPLLVSVRSGAPLSMPGMMDTVLNLGLNDQTIKGLIKQTGNKRFVYDAYRRFVQMYGNVVLGIEKDKFEHLLEKYKEEEKVKQDIDLDSETLKKLVKEFKEIVKKEIGKPFPEEPLNQLNEAIKAVFKSWNNKRAITYRKINKISDDLGTAVNVQSMVFGNMGNDSATGVAFTRNPSTGEDKFYGEYLINAQGEDVVAGIRTPKPVEEMKKDLPEIYKELVKVREILEKHYRDVQDFEFTIQNGKLYMLQTRTGKRTAQAAVKIAVDMLKEGLITKEEALLRVDPNQLDQLLHRHIDPKVDVKPVANGLPASPGAAQGKVVFSADEAEERGDTGEKVILVSTETTPEDIHGMVKSQGILTSRGGMTSHAAVVSRGMGIPCVAGCESIKVNLKEKKFSVGGITVKEGDLVTIDGSTGNVMLGEVPMVDPELTKEFKELLGWTDEQKKLGVWANASTPKEAANARKFGAEGIGLCRTERMFNDPDRLPIVQSMILAESLEERKIFLNKLMPMQKSDFEEMFTIMDGLPVTIRLLDLPLHEFLPVFEDILVEVTELEAKGKKVPEDKKRMLKRIRELHEHNPMIGHRGCRVGITYPEIYEMQTRAIIEAAISVKKRGIKPLPEIMIPLVGHVNEMKYLREIIEKTAKEVLKKNKEEIKYTIGTMMELPRASLTADEIAEYAEFFSFGTNDLTQTTYGYSRDDIEGKFLPFYLEKKILPDNPFQTVDRRGVGKLMDMGVKLGRSARKNLKVGICGEVGGDPETIKFCHEIGLNYVSCSPFRVPIARLSAAQANIAKKVERDV